jgi:hypothetical protein
MDMTMPFQLNPGESILYRSSPSLKWYALAWRIGVEVLEVAVFILISFTALTNLSKGILARFLPAGPTDMLSLILFQGFTPLLVLVWFAEDTFRIFTFELILTNQRIWTKGSPFAWTPARETPLSDIKSMSSRHDALFVRLKSTKKRQMHVLSDGKQIVKAFVQFTGKASPD